MARYALAVMVLAGMQLGSLGAAAAEDNPVVRTLLREAIKKELAARDSKDKGWHQGNTWLWLDNPSANLGADVTSLTLQDGRVAIEGRASALVGFQHKVALLIGSKTFAGQARVYLSFKASALAGEKLTGATVNINRLEIYELHMHGNVLQAFHGMIQDGVNLLLRQKKRDIEKKLEDALNRANVPSRLRAASAANQ